MHKHIPHVHIYISQVSSVQRVAMLCTSLLFALTLCVVLVEGEGESKDMLVILFSALMNTMLAMLLGIYLSIYLSIYLAIYLSIYQYFIFLIFCCRTFFAV